MTGSFASSLITKLSVANHLDGEDIRAILSLPIRSRQLAAHELIVRDGDCTDECCLVSEGFAFRAKTTIDGQRQILSLHIPGEIPDLQSLHLKVIDHDLTTLTRCTLGFISHSALNSLNIARPNVAAALWRETLVDAAIFREWIVNLGRRAGIVRLAHLLVELHYRLHAIGRARDGTFELAISQLELADCLGMSVVHTNRMLKELREQGLLRIERGAFHFPSELKVIERGQFDSSYLHHPLQA